MQRLIVFKNVIGSYDALKMFFSDYDVFREATEEERKIWELKQKTK